MRNNFRRNWSNLCKSGCSNRSNLKFYIVDTGRYFFSEVVSIHSAENSPVMVSDSGPFDGISSNSERSRKKVCDLTWNDPVESTGTRLPSRNPDELMRSWFDMSILSELSRSISLPNGKTSWLQRGSKKRVRFGFFYLVRFGSTKIMDACIISS